VPSTLFQSHPMKLVKLGVVGAASVGKTCLAERMADGSFSDFGSPTCGVNFRLVKALVVDGRAARLHVWDIGGDPKYSLVVESYLRSVQAILVCYDTTRRETLDEALVWLEKAQHFAPDKAQFVLCGTKCDAGEDEGINNSASALAASLGIPWVLTSAKYGTGVDEAFTTLVRSVCNATVLKEQQVRHANTHDLKDSPRLRVSKTAAAAMGTSAIAHAERPAMLPVSTPLQTIAEQLYCPTVAVRFCGDSCSRLMNITTQKHHDTTEPTDTCGPGADPMAATPSHLVEERSGGVAEMGYRVAPACKQQLRA